MRSLSYGREFPACGRMTDHAELGMSATQLAHAYGFRWSPGPVQPYQGRHDEHCEALAAPVYTKVYDAADVTEEIKDMCWEIVDGWYQQRPVDWPDVWDRLDGSELADGTLIDLGEDLTSAALVVLRAEMKKRRKG